MKRVTVVCQNVGDYKSRGTEYVAKLFDGFRRYMPADIETKYVCITDNPASLPSYAIAKSPLGLTGWWCKMAMFAPETFEADERILACDLDTLITGDLSDIAGYDGEFAALNDPYHPLQLSSSLMTWRAGHLHHVWGDWNAAERPTERFGVFGDGGCLEHFHPQCDRLQSLFPGQIYSFKSTIWLIGQVPPNARVVFFHGRPKPHECRAPYIVDLWNQPPLDVAS